MGPTASGKTRLAITLSQLTNVELISVDSSLVYKGLDIGSAKPTAEEQALAPHRLIDICDPSEPYSVAQFCSDAEREIRDVLDRGNTPLLVGGTMLYFRALLHGLSPMPKADAEVRDHIWREAESRGWPAMHRELQDIDPQLAAKLHPNHSHRIARALEVYRVSGKPLSAWHSEHGNALLDQFDWRQIALVPTHRAALHHNIERRFDAMLQQGFIDEVRKLKDRGDLHLQLPALRAVGYRQIWQYLNGDYDQATMREKALAASRQLAKRQLTWLRSWPDTLEIDPYKDDGGLCATEEILSKCLPYLGQRDL